MSFDSKVVMRKEKDNFVVTQTPQFSSDEDETVHYCFYSNISSPCFDSIEEKHNVVCHFFSTNTAIGQPRGPDLCAIFLLVSHALHWPDKRNRSGRRRSWSITKHSAWPCEWIGPWLTFEIPDDNVDFRNNGLLLWVPFCCHRNRKLYYFWNIFCRCFFFVWGLSLQCRISPGRCKIMNSWLFFLNGWPPFLSWKPLSKFLYGCVTRPSTIFRIPMSFAS